MIFTPENARLILEGRKTQTRRLIKHGEYLDWTQCYRAISANGRIKYAVNRSYAVQPGRTKAAIGRIRITAIRRERLCDISANDAYSEGLSGGYVLSQFVALWNEINGCKPGTRWSDNPLVWVLTFEVVK